MPKLKTNKSTAKRFKVTKHGKILRKRAGKGHLLSGKSRKRKRHLKKTVVAHKVEVKRLKRLLGLIG
ncbi:MAG: 50S ribosomal protein L35 [Planctomycetes bacterium]|nr:50S ribosomal protein L35 [Planctomycetota bacterium]